MKTNNKLKLNPAIIASCRKHAFTIAQQVQQFIDAHTTLSVERAALRLLGVDGVDAFGIPLPNLMVDQVKKQGDLARGVSVYLAAALAGTGMSLADFCHAFNADRVSLVDHELPDKERTKAILAPYLEVSLQRIASQRAHREALLAQHGWHEPAIYVIVATGNIHEDVVQARAAALTGADIIAVIRSTGQSLLDYVPYGATTEGFGGTLATQENFRIMRAALDEVGEALQRYIKLVNYASGLCMPEIAAMGALERLDMMLNDSMYGIIFRDINMQRTFVDQYCSRSINALAGITINTGEDNYLTTADAVDSAHTVLASQFINERFAQLAGLPATQTGLGHAFEIDPMRENSFLYEIAQAQMAREIFPDAPLKYMPPTRHSTGNIFHTQAIDTMFNAATVMTGQSIHLLAMMTEAIHTPFLSDRHLAIQNARMVQAAMRDMQEEICFREDGIIINRAHEVLARAEQMLAEVANKSLFTALEEGLFADVKRGVQGGKGLDGVIKKNELYQNPVMDAVREALS